LHPFPFKPHIILPYGWVKLHCIYHILLYIYTHIYIFIIDTYHIFLIHPSVSIWIVSKAWLLWTMLQWKLVYRCLNCILTYLPLGRCPEVESLDQVPVLSLAFWGNFILLSIVVVLICIPTNVYRIPEYLL
jgi:hypothetical protein